MKRLIYTVIKFSSETLSVVALEKNDEKLHDFFSDTKQCATLEKMQQFIKNSITTIESKINGKIKKVFVQIDDTKSLNLNVKLIGQKKAIPTEIIQKSDIKTILLNVRNEFSGLKMETIFAQPIKYLVKESLHQNVAYLTPPIDKKGIEMEIICSKVAIDKEVGLKVRQFLGSLNLEVIEFLATSNVIPFLVADKQVTTKGLANLHINKKFATISIVQNNALINYRLINLGVDLLIKEITHKYNLSTSLVTKLFKSHKEFLFNRNSNFDFNKPILSSSNVTYQNIAIITQKFLQEIFEQTKSFLMLNAIQGKLPLFITGKMNELVEFGALATKSFDGQDVYVYQNKYQNYIAQSNDSAEAIGVVKYINRLDNVIDDKKYVTLIETQPIKISNLLPNKLSLFQMIVKKTFNKKNLGGKHA